MRPSPRFLGRLLSLLHEAAIGSTRTVLGHWMLAGFSLATAFGIWMAVQDVDNPVLDGVVPADGTEIQISEAVNLPDGLIVESMPPVTVEVEARKSVFEGLTQEDFEATVEIPKDSTAGLVFGKVTVTPKNDRVRVLNVIPESVVLTLAEAETKELAVTVNYLGLPPAGYELSKDQQVQLDPAVVTVQGKKDLVDRIATIELDANLREAHDGTTVVEGDLVARTVNRNTLQVKISQTRARATFKIDQVFTQRIIALTASVPGIPAPGFAVTNVVVDPPTVLVTGPKLTIDALKTLNVEKVDVTGASTTINRTRQIVPVPNVSTDRQAVFVRVDIQAIDCGGTEKVAPCEPATVFVSPTIERPPGLVPDAAITVAVRISGPLAQVAALKPSDVKATLTLTGAPAGAGTYQPKVTAPAGIRIESVEPVIINLVPISPVLP